MTERRLSSPEEYARQDMPALVGYLLKQGILYEDARDAARGDDETDGRELGQHRESKGMGAEHRPPSRDRCRPPPRSEDEKTWRSRSQAFAVEMAADDLWMLKEEQRAVISRIRELPAAQRQALALHLGGFTNTEIAQIIGAKAKTVGSSLRHAKRRLQNILEAEGLYRPKGAPRANGGG